MILCKTKNVLKVEYALRDIHKPVGVSGYIVKHLKSLPKKFESSLPTIEDIEMKLLPKKAKRLDQKRTKKF